MGGESGDAVAVGSTMILSTGPTNALPRLGLSPTMVFTFVWLLLSSLLCFLCCYFYLLLSPAAHARSVVAARRPSHSGNLPHNT